MLASPRALTLPGTAKAPPITISAAAQARQLTGGGGVLLHAQRSEHVKGRSRQAPKCGLSATCLAAAGILNDVWVKFSNRNINSVWEKTLKSTKIMIPKEFELC